MSTNPGFREDVVLGLKLLGYEHHRRGEHWDEYRHPNKPKRHLFVNASGAIRVGRAYSTSEMVQSSFAEYARRRAQQIDLFSVGK